MKNSVAILMVLLGFTGNLWCQVPGCFEVQSILVDACGSPEGENEMVRFEVGANSLNVNDLVANWPNNAFQGFCQNNTTQNTVSDMNATIESCGYFLEPTAGVLPANAKVLLITSTNFDATSHAYNGLQDTVHVIFQCAGNTQGHFANWTNGCDPNSGDRTLTLDFGNGCAQTVTYNKCDLLNQSGGIGGNSADRDGARVDFDNNGTPSYANEGCTIPFEAIEVDMELVLSDGVLCPGESINLSGTVTNTAIYEWMTQGGTFVDDQDLTTEFTDTSNGSGSYYIYLSAENGCGETVRDSMLITVLSDPSVSIDSTVLSMDSCQLDEVLLTASGANQYEWSTGETGDFIVADTAGIFSVIGTSECSSDTADILIDPSMNCDQDTLVNEPEANDKFEIVIPNVFTPNNDDVNDIFGVHTNREVKMEYVLLNRWGNVMKEGSLHTTTTGLNECWKGDHKGKSASTGTYFYKLKVTFNGTGEKRYQGAFQLLR